MPKTSTEVRHMCRRWLALLVIAGAGSCGADELGTAEQAVTHVPDLSSVVPAKFSFMHTLASFGIDDATASSGDRQGPGPDTSYGNWKWNPGSDPTNCYGTT